MSRSGSRNFLQAVGAHSMRANAGVAPFWYGEVKSYDPETHYCVVTIDLGFGKTYDTPPSPIVSPFWGQGYGDQAGPPTGAQALVVVVDPGGNLFAVLGFTPNMQDPGFDIPSDERKMLDKRGSYAWWSAARGGVLRLFGAAIATLFAGTRIELGGEDLDTTNDAVIRKSDLDAALAAQTGHVQTAFNTFAATVQGGSGVAAPTVAATTSSGSTKVTAA